MSRAEQKSRIALILAMFIFGTIGVFRRYIPLSSSMLAMFRGYIGMLFIAMFVLIKKDRLSWRSIKENIGMLLTSGIFIAFNWILLFEAYKYTSVAAATLSYYMAPIIVILLSPIFLKERISLRKACCIAVALIGMVLVSGVLEGGDNGIKGIFFGLGAASFYAGIVIINKRMKQVQPYEKTIVQLGTAAIAITPYVLLTENGAPIEFTLSVVIMIIILGIIHTGIAYALYFSSMKNLEAQTVALFSYIDPIVAIILSALFLREHMGVLSIIGAILVLSATMAGEVSGFRRKTR